VIEAASTSIVSPHRRVGLAVRFLLAVSALFSIAACTATQEAHASPADDTFVVPQWAFPTTTPGLPAAKPPYDTITALHVPHSTRSFTLAQVKDPLNPPDWFPHSHAPAPDVVIHARKEITIACGVCHLPDGQGRSENATIVGLPTDYFLRQLTDMRDSSRHSAVAGWAPSARMSMVTTKITDEEARAAARYFGAMRAKRRYRVLERATIPATFEAGGLRAAKAGIDSEPIAGRLVEVSDDIGRHELRDAGETFTTFVPPGSIARGRRMALIAPRASATRCATCHGSTLRGAGVVPPLAGRSPAYVLRQLIGFKSGARAGRTSAAMQRVTSQLTLDDMIALAAYAGSRKP
jgi:cytochrome c553